MYVKRRSKGSVSDNSLGTSEDFPRKLSQTVNFTKFQLGVHRIRIYTMLTSDRTLISHADGSRGVQFLLLFVCFFSRRYHKNRHS